MANSCFLGGKGSILIDFRELSKQGHCGPCFFVLHLKIQLIFFVSDPKPITSSLTPRPSHSPAAAASASYSTNRYRGAASNSYGARQTYNLFFRRPSPSKYHHYSSTTPFYTFRKISNPTTTTTSTITTTTTTTTTTTKPPPVVVPQPQPPQTSAVGGFFPFPLTREYAPLFSVVQPQLHLQPQQQQQPTTPQPVLHHFFLVSPQTQQYPSNIGPVHAPIHQVSAAPIVGPPPIHFAPAPVHHAPAPAHHAPAPVHHAPAPIIAPAPQINPAPAPIAPQPSPFHFFTTQRGLPAQEQPRGSPQVQENERLKIIAPVPIFNNPSTQQINSNRIRNNHKARIRPAYENFNINQQVKTQNNKVEPAYKDPSLFTAKNNLPLPPIPQVKVSPKSGGFLHFTPTAAPVLNSGLAVSPSVAVPHRPLPAAFRDFDHAPPPEPVPPPPNTPLENKPHFAFFTPSGKCYGTVVVN